MAANRHGRNETGRRDTAGRDAPERGGTRSNSRPDAEPLRAAALYEIVSTEGKEELSLAATTLWWSGLAAGLSIGFSFVAQAAIASHLEQTPSAPLITALGYPVGFLIVMLGRQPLLEATLTAVLPVVRWRSLRWLGVLLRLWGIVLAANLTGSLIFAAVLSVAGLPTEAMSAAMIGLGETMLRAGPVEAFLKATAAGWLIAALIWSLPAVKGEEFIVIAFVTYLIAIAGFTHIGPAVPLAFTMLLGGHAALGDVLGAFFIPALFGNLVGGTALFVILALEQSRRDD